MLMGIELMCVLSYTGPKQYKALLSECKKEDLERIIKFDRSYYIVYDFHVVTNIDEVKKELEKYKRK